MFVERIKGRRVAAKRMSIWVCQGYVGSAKTGEHQDSQFSTLLREPWFELNGVGRTI